MTRAQWIKEATKYVTSTNPITSAPTWLLELAVRYGRLADMKGLRTQTEFKMHKLCTSLDEWGVKEISDVWQYMVVNEIAEARAAKRAVPKVEVPRVQKSRRPTAAATVLALLREVPVRNDAQIIEAVHAATFHDGFNQLQLNWYKNQFKQGRLKGQAGSEVIHEQAEKGLGKPSKAPKTASLAART